MTTFFKLSVLLLGTAIAQISAAEISYEQELKQGCAKIKPYAQLGKNITISVTMPKRSISLNYRRHGHIFVF